MRSREEQKVRRDKKCRHFNGIQNGMCDSKVEYPSDVDICFGDGGENECGGYDPLTAEELAKKEADMQRHMDLMRQGFLPAVRHPSTLRR